MIGGTVVEYGKDPRNGVADFVMYHCTTHKIEQESVFEESGTDMLYYRFTIHVSGVVHGRVNWNKFQKRQANGAADSTPTFEHRGLRAALDNRQTFRMRMGVDDDADLTAGEELFHVEPWPDAAAPRPAGGMLHWDANDGPRCEVLSVDHVSGNEVFRISAKFTVCVVECDPASTGDPGTAKNNTLGILSNRWSSSDDIDNEMITTRTYSGRLRVASSKINPHLLRRIVVPPLMARMRRERMTFTVAIDGKTLDWTVVDKEVIQSAPHPAKTWNVEHSVDTDTAMLSMMSCTVSMSGDRSADPRKMISAAFHVIIEKLYFRANNGKTPGVITKRMSVSTETGDRNTIRVHCTVQSASSEKENVTTALEVYARYTTIGKVIEIPNYQSDKGSYDPRLSDGARPGDRIEVEGAVKLATIFHARLQTPCDNDHYTDQRRDIIQKPWPEVGPVADSNPGSPTVETTVVDNVWGEVPGVLISAGHAEAPYTTYTMESVYKTKGMIAALPVASAFASGPPGVIASAASTAPLLNGTVSPSSTSARDTVKLIRLGAPSSKRTQRVMAERIGQWPVLPKPEDYTLENGGRAVVNDVAFLPGTTEMTVDGQQLFRAGMDVEYLLTRPVDASVPLRVGNNPWNTIGMQMTAGVAMFDSETFTPKPGSQS